MVKLRHFGLFAAIVAILIGAGILAGKLFPRPGQSAPPPSSMPEADSSDSEIWRRQHPWLFKDSAFAPYAQVLILPWFRQSGLSPRNLVKRPGYLEAIFPRGRPIHEAAYDLESLCGKMGIRVLEGRELSPPGERVEYRLRAASGPALVLRASLGKSALPGAARLALVIVGLDRVDEAALRRLLALPFPLTLAMALDSGAASGRFPAFPPGKEALVELPMEPVAYPFVKPGPGALFIHHSRAEIQGLMDARFQRVPKAKGFATKYGDRAVGSRPLMQKVMEYSASRSLLFLDLTASPRSVAAAAARQAGASAFAARVQDAGSEGEFEAELAHRLGMAQKAGEGVWALRYSPGLPAALEKLMRKHQGRFGEIGLAWVTLSGLKKR